MEHVEPLTVADAAVKLERSTEQVRRYLREGRLTGRRIGGQWFIEPDALDHFSTALAEERSFLNQVVPANESRPLDLVIGLAGGGGSDLSEGKDAYRRAVGWRR